MANRFGRNQRRKLQQALQAAENAATIAERERQTVLILHNAMRTQFTRWARDVEELAGPHSAFNEVINRYHADPHRVGPRFHVPFPENLTLPTLSPPSATIDHACKVIEALVWQLEISPDDFRQQVRIILENEHGETFGYAISREQIWTERDVDQFARMIASEIVRFRNRSY